MGKTISLPINLVTRQPTQNIDWQPLKTILGKTLSLALIFNSLLCVFYSIGVLAGVYTQNWKIFEPYLVGGNLLWILILTSILDVFLALKVNGFGLGLFRSEIPKLLQLIGITKKTPRPKSKIIQRILFVLQTATIFTSFYMFFAVTVYMSQVATAHTLPNLILSIALLFTSLASLGATIFKTWLKQAIK